MFSVVKNISTIVLIINLTIGLVACGGGDDGGGSTKPVTQDRTPPMILTTNPGSEQIGFETNTSITVRFSETIVNVDSSQVGIYAFDANGVASRTPLVMKPEQFIFDDVLKILTIKPEVDTLQKATKYLVSIQGITDIAGNKMVDNCSWEFGTVGYPDFGVGKTGVCGTNPGTPGNFGAPNEVFNVFAVAGDNRVSISWQAPMTGKPVTYYVLKRYSDKGLLVDVIDDAIPNTIFLFGDLSAKNGTAYTYRVFATNSVGQSKGVQSNTVIPVAIQVSTTPDAPRNVIAVAGDAKVMVSWSKPKAGDTVVYYQIERSADGAAYDIVNNNIPATIFNYDDLTVKSGTSYIYRVSAANILGLSTKVLSKAVTPKTGMITPARLNF